MNKPDSYAAAGVDVAAGERAVELMKSAISNAQRPEVIGGLGGFAGLFDASALKNYNHPVLTTATDGVGTKVAIAQALDKHDTIGIDLVAMVVDDLVVTGSEPLFLTDYIACGSVDPERIATIVGGIAAGCAAAGCALLGGETAEHPGLMAPDEYDLAAAGTGVVERERMLGSHLVQAGDVLIAMASSGVHANGLSLARSVFPDPEQWRQALPGLPADTLGAELLTPTAIYTKPCLELDRTLSGGLHALSHVTGGGLAANLARVLPTGLGATIDRASWRPQVIFDKIAEVGQIDRAEMEIAFNMGVGMVAVVSAETATSAIETLQAAGVTSWNLGVVTETDGVELRGDYRN